MGLGKGCVGFEAAEQVCMNGWGWGSARWGVGVGGASMEARGDEL